MTTAAPTPTWPAPTRGDFELDSFRFDSGETLPKLRLHYQTLGTPRRDPATGRVCNAVLIMHGTGGSSDQFLRPSFAGELFNAGQPLDASVYFIILRDGIGHGRSSRPSDPDGLRAGFPRYGYADMVRADHALLTSGLGVDHLRLVMGTSMGGMHTWLWAGTHPSFVDAAMPLASLPTQIAGRNRMSRKMIVDAIRSDPDYRAGDYSPDRAPLHGLTTAIYILAWMGSCPLQWQREAPSRDEADAFLDRHVADALARGGPGGMDANDTLYQIGASADYDPRPLLSSIRCPLIAVNSADDQVNPPELGILEAEIKKVARGRAVVLPVSAETRGHGSHTIARLWMGELKALLEKSGGVP